MKIQACDNFGRQQQCEMDSEYIVVLKQVDTVQIELSEFPPSLFPILIEAGAYKKARLPFVAT